MNYLSREKWGICDVFKILSLRVQLSSFMVSTQKTM